MPRGRGGQRDGVAGKAYQNRSDLRGQNVVAAQPQNQPGAKLAVQAATGQPYGAAGAQKAAQQAIPMGTPSLPQPQSAPVQGMQPDQGQPSAPLTSLFAPTQKPNEPVTAGVANSPGVGPDALNIPEPIVGQYQSAKVMIQQLASDPNASPALQWLAQRINGVY